MQVFDLKNIWNFNLFLMFTIQKEYFKLSKSKTWYSAVIVRFGNKSIIKTESTFVLTTQITHNFEFFESKRAH